MKKNNFIKLFKSVVSLLMVVALLFAFAGCSSSGGKDNGEENNANSGNSGNNKPNFDNLTPSEYFVALETYNVGGFVDALTSAYSALAQSSNTANYCTEMDISLNVGDKIQDLLADNYYAMSGTRVDFSFLSKVNLEVDLSVKDKLQQMDMGIGLGSNRILTLRTIMDLTNFTTWVGAPELSNIFAEMNMSELGQMGGMAVNMGTMQSSAALIDALPDAEKLNALIKRYIEIALENLKNVERKDTTLQLNGLSQNCTVLSVKIYKQDALNAVKAVLNEAKTDAELKTLINEFSGSFNQLMADASAQAGGYWSNIDLYNAFTLLITQTLNNLEMEAADLDTESYIELNTYVDSDHNVIGRRLSVDDLELHYYTVTQGNNFTFEAELGDASITGSGTNQSGTINGTYKLNVDGSDLLEVEVKNWSANGNTVKGSLIFEPAADLVEEAMDGMPFTNIALELKLDTNESQSAFEINMLSNKELLVGIGMSVKTSSGGPIQKPTQTIDFTNQYQLQNWVDGMNFDKLIQNLRNAGVPSALIDLLENNLY